MNLFFLQTDTRFGLIPSEGANNSSLDEQQGRISGLGASATFFLDLDYMTKNHWKYAAKVLLCLVSVSAVSTLASSTSAAAAATRPLPRAHAHNDYNHPQPLQDALRHGFCSVEADIFLHDGKLLVGHARQELRPHRTLQALYLDPLRERVTQGGGQVYPGGPPFTLLVDIKSDGPTTYAKLSEVLADYQQMCSAVDAGKLTRRGVEIVVSGNRPISEIKASSPRRVFVDGRISELDSPESSLVVPLVSDNWSNFFEWRGRGPLPELQQTKLRKLVDQVHQGGRRLRFWATPDDPRVWQVLADAGVDVIGADDLGALQRFLADRDSAGASPTETGPPNAAESPNTSGVPNTNSAQD